MKLQILVTTMHQTDLSKVKEMNITGPVLLANQADRYDYCKDDSGAEMVTTPTRGLSKNRNIAIECSSKEARYLVFADDDLVFKDNYEELILTEFENHPEAEAIKFNLYNISKTRKISMKPISYFHKATRRSVTSSGVCALAIRQDILLQKNLRFNEFFGTGTENYCGEDTIFLQELINKKVAFFLSPVEIAGIDQTESSWFEGHNEKFFRTAGMTIAAVYPSLAKLITIRSAYKFARRGTSKLTFREILRCYWKGIDIFLHGG